MKKRGQIWVSAVLYIALGMIVITLILSAGVPMINKIRDRNTVAQTKNVMLDIHNNIQAVTYEAKGSTRYLSPVDINAGQLFIDQGGDNRTMWTMTTKNKMMENDTDFTEGDLHQFLTETAIEGEYDIMLYLGYTAGNVDLKLSPQSQFQNPFQGRFSFTIKNQGYPCPATVTDCPIEVEITVTG